ncbi:MAG TPA: T9SS type A sorting domain-containing protein [Prolixibacteraceae bacterium]|nr:T9SS type A sorting domain-containing protein [Prolixibacteraceae bacterium]
MVQREHYKKYDKLWLPCIKKQKMKPGIIYTAFLGLLFINSAYSQWIQTDGPYGNIKINSIFAYNGEVYAGTSCGLHSTSGATERWALRASFDVEAFLLKENTLYFGGPNLGIRVMNMEDQTFKHTSRGLDGVTVLTLTDGDTCMYGSVLNQGFCKSMGNSTTWNFFNRGLPAVPRQYPPSQGGGTYYSYHVNTIALLNDTLLCGTQEGVYRAPAGAIVWRTANNGLPRANVQQLKVFGKLIFACMGNSLYYSADTGTSWIRKYDFGAEISSVNISDNYFLITTLGNGIYGSTDGGKTFQTFNRGLGDLNITGITHIGNMPICATRSGGVYFVSGNTWVSNPKGIICSTIMSMVSTPSSIVANDDQNVFASSPRSYPWAIISPETDKNYFGSLAAKGDTLFLSYKGNTWESIIKYRLPGSNTWDDLKGPLPYEGDDASLMNTGNGMLWVYEDDILFNTSDLGQTWNEHSIPSGFCNNFSDFEIFNGLPFAAACGKGEMLRMAADRSWQLSNAGLPTDREVTSMAYSKEAIYAFVDTYGMFVSKDNGQTWEVATNGFYTGWGIHSHAFRGQDIFVTTAKGVFYSIDQGQKWQSLNDGLPNIPVGPMVIYNDTLWVGTHGNGIWKRDLASIPTLKKDSAIVIQHIKIFPNPATEYVYFDFADSQKATVQLVDMLGRVLLTTKLDEQKRIPVDRYASGTYVIVITTDRYVYNSVLIKKR